MNEEKMRKEFEYWYKSPTNADLVSKLAWLSWKTACASKQKEIDTLLYAVARKFDGETRFETALRYIREAESHEACGSANESHEEKPPVDPEEVYSPHTEVIKC